MLLWGSSSSNRRSSSEEGELELLEEVHLLLELSIEEAHGGLYLLNHGLDLLLLVWAHGITIAKQLLLVANHLVSHGQHLLFKCCAHLLLLLLNHQLLCRHLLRLHLRLCLLGHCHHGGR